MTGSPLIASWIAHAAFWSLLGRGWFTGQLGGRSIAAFLGLWAAAFAALPYVPYGRNLFAPAVALLDIALVLTIFKGDVRIT